MLESFSSHLFVRQVNMFILNLCLTFHSLSVLFICFINKSILCKSVLYIHFFFKKIQHIQSQYGSHIVPHLRLMNCYLPWERKFPELQSLVCPQHALAVGTGFLNFVLMFYCHDTVNVAVVLFWYSWCLSWTC